MLNDSNPMTNENTSGKERPLETAGFADLLNRLGDSLTRMEALMNAPPVVRLPIPLAVWPVSMPDVPDEVSDDLYDAARDEADMENEAHVGGGGHATAD